MQSRSRRQRLREGNTWRPNRFACLCTVVILLIKWWERWGCDEYMWCICDGRVCLFHACLYIDGKQRRLLFAWRGCEYAYVMHMSVFVSRVTPHIDGAGIISRDDCWSSDETYEDVMMHMWRSSAFGCSRGEDAGMWVVFTEWWVMSDEWWMMTDEWWAMSDEWWVMSDEWLVISDGWMMSDEWWVMSDEWWVMSD